MSEKTTHNSFTHHHDHEAHYRYVPVEEHLKDEDGNIYVSYGISARMIDDEIAFVSDISTDHEKVKRIAELCTERELSPEHLQDVIDDFLIDEAAITV